MKDQTIREKALVEFAEQHELDGQTALRISFLLPEAIKIYKKMYKAGNTYEAIKAELKFYNHSVGGWLYDLADEISQQEI